MPDPRVRTNAPGGCASPRRPRRLPALLLGLAVGLAPPAVAHAAATIVMLDGSRARGNIQAVTHAGELQLNKGRTLALEEVLRIDRDGVKVAGQRPANTVAELRLTDGSLIHATKLTVDGGRATFDWQGGRASQLPLGQVRAIRFDLAEGEQAVDRSVFIASRKAERANRDSLFIEREGKLLSVDGVLEQIDPDKVRFRFNDASRTIDRAKVFGLTLALTAAPPETSGWAGVRLNDGSRVWGEIVGLDGKTLTLDRGDETRLSLDWTKVARVDSKSPRLIFLDTLEPDRQRNRAIVTYPWPMQRRRNVMGEPMRLGDRAYDRGLGVHAASELTYRLDGGYERLVATIGIDASTAELGDCVFRVEGDGRTLHSVRARGGEANTILVDISGVDRLTLAVDPGENLDIGDRANWANARLIRSGE